MNAKDISIKRAKELKAANEEFLAFKKSVKRQEILDQESYEKKKAELLILAIKDKNNTIQFSDIDKLVCLFY